MVEARGRAKHPLRAESLALLTPNSGLKPTRRAVSRVILNWLRSRPRVEEEWPGTAESAWEALPAVVSEGCGAMPAPPSGLARIR